MDNVMQTVINELTNRADEIAKLRGEVARLDETIKSGRASQQVIERELQPARTDARIQITRCKEAALRTVAGIVNQHIKELENADTVKPDELNDDLKVLNSGISLTKRDLQVMLERNSDNRTMSRMILQWAREHGIDTGTAYVGNEQAIENARNINSAASLYVNHWIDSDKAHEMVQKMFVDTQE